MKKDIFVNTKLFFKKKKMEKVILTNFELFCLLTKYLLKDYKENNIIFFIFFLKGIIKIRR